MKQAAGPLPPFIQELRSQIRIGNKTQTRRLIRLTDFEQDAKNPGQLYSFRNRKGTWQEVSNADLAQICPYGRAGQIRYLREPIYKGPGGFAHYVDDDAMVWDSLTGQRVAWHWKPKTLSQLYMSAAFARTFVRLSAIRPERLQDISESDAIAEGIELIEHELGTVRFQGLAPVLRASHSSKFAILWDKINAKRGYPWAGNWWVWVLGFCLIGGSDGNENKN
jgi:hypothetical protein